MTFTPGSPGSPPFPRPPRPIRPKFQDQRNQSKDEHRINERIRVPQVRLIDDVGGQVGVVATPQALQMARDKGLDLVEVAPEANPPVCKILDYGKFKYEKKKKDHEAKKKQTVIKVKEIQLRPQTEQHDLDYKFKNIRQFLTEGDKAKITILFRGREIVYADQGRKIMNQLIELMKDISIVESYPKLEGKRMMMVLAPSVGGAKKPPSKIVIKPVQPPSGGDKASNS